MLSLPVPESLQSAHAVECGRFRLGMRHLAAGVTVITTDHEGHRAGLTATAVCSVSADPPLLLVCINKKVRAHDLIRASGRFCVNVLAAEQQNISEVFGSPNVENRFSVGHWSTLETGAPALEKALVNFDCQVCQAIPAATHTVYLGTVVAVRHKTDQEALVYFDGNYRALASNPKPAHWWP